MSSEGVTYTVKELISMLERTLTDQLQALGSRLDGIDRKLDTKSDLRRVEAAELRLSVVEKRIGDLELLSAGTQAVAKYRFAAAGLTLAAISAIAALLYVVLGAHP